MRQRVWLLFLIVFAVVGIVTAQRAPAPALAECGQQGDVEVICGARAPEDLELTPDGNRIIVAQFGRGAAAGTGIVLFDPDAQDFRDLPVRVEPRPTWGEAACVEPEGMALNPHGLSLATHPDGVVGLYVVNHNLRESVEMFEVAEVGGGWELIWRGCLSAEVAYNDLAMLPNGGFVGTRPTALQEPGANAFGGGNSGDVAVWTPESGEVVLPDTASGFPNGVAVDPEGRFAYIAVWTGQGAIKYDLERRERVATVDLGFMPDNLTWTADGRLLAAGIQGIGGDCGGVPCIQGFEVAEIDPETMNVRTVYRSEAPPSPISGVSVAIQLEDDVYVGSFQGDRLVRIDWTD